MMELPSAEEALEIYGDEAFNSLACVRSDAFELELLKEKVSE